MQLNYQQTPCRFSCSSTSLLLVKELPLSLALASTESYHAKPTCSAAWHTLSCTEKSQSPTAAHQSFFQKARTGFEDGESSATRLLWSDSPLPSSHMLARWPNEEGWHYSFSMPSEILFQLREVAASPPNILSLPKSQLTSYSFTQTTTLVFVLCTQLPMTRDQNTSLHLFLITPRCLGSRHCFYL